MAKQPKGKSQNGWPVQWREKQGGLLSLKAGNTGLNLSSADTVILYDFWWNPTMEEQTAGRPHQMGKKMWYKWFEWSLKEWLKKKYELQQSKKELFETVVQTRDVAISRITEKEIREILNI